MAASEATRAAAARLVRRYPVARAALLPLLHLLQAEHGRITDEAIGFCADALGLTRAEVGAVSSFYSMFKPEPVGDWLLSVCTNPPCRLAGGQEIYDRYRQRLGGDHDEEAGVSVEHTECLGICDAAPVVQVNYEMFGPLTHEEADELADRVLEGDPPASNWSGEVPPTFREVERQLAGVEDGLDEQWAAAARQQVEDHEEPPAYRSGETDIPVTNAGGDPRGHGGEVFRATGGAAPGSMLPGGDGRVPPEEAAADGGEGSDHEVQSATGGVSGARPGGRAVPLGGEVSGNGVGGGLSCRYGIEGAHRLEVYERHGGYEGARRALEMDPEDLRVMIEDSGLRGRGGAGFPTGVKWSFMARDTGRPSYIVANADEGEPGTFKDRALMERDPHAVVEGMIVAGHALGAEYGWLYLRGEFAFAGRRMRDAVREAYEAGHLGDDVLGTGRRFHLMLHRGAGAYICGEETALLESLEGRRGQPRLRPPFPATHGLFGCPTTVNNVESLAATPHIVRHGPQWFTAWGTKRSTGPKLVCISGEVARPGNYELAMGTPLGEMIEAAGGMAGGRTLKFLNPGGSSTPYLTADHLDVPYTFEDIQEAGSLLGTGGLMVFSEQTCVVATTLRFTEFYEHESCGKCTPCREGTYWLSQVLRRIERGNGRMEDLDLLEDVCGNMLGKNFCALGDGAVMPITSGLEHFRDEYEAHVRRRRCPLGATPPEATRPLVLETTQASPGGTVAPAGMARPTAPGQAADEARVDKRPGRGIADG